MMSQDEASARLEAAQIRRVVEHLRAVFAAAVAAERRASRPVRTTNPTLRDFRRGPGRL
jgi:hypothetical protein